MEKRSSSSKSMDPVIVHDHGYSTEFLKKLRGVLGDHLKLQESQVFCLKNSSDAANGVLQNPSRTFRKKRTPRFDASHLDVPSTSEVVSAASTLQVLHEDGFKPQFSWKEENLVSAFPQNFTQELSLRKEEAFKKPTAEPKIWPKNQRKRGPDEDFIEGKMRAVKKVKRSLNPVLQNPSPELPINFKTRIQDLTGSAEVEVVFIYEKTLFRTDVNPGQNRFLIPLKQVKNNFLTEEEKEILKTGDEISGKGSIEALLIQPSLDQCKINLRKWDMGGKSSGKVSENYVLVTTWNKVVKDNNMAEGMIVQLWSFRRGDELCFALVNRG